MGAKHDVISTFAIVQNLVENLNKTYFLKKYEMIPETKKMSYVWVAPDDPDGTKNWTELRELLNTAEKEVHKVFQTWRYNVTEKDLEKVAKTANTFKSNAAIEGGVSWYIYIAFTIGAISDVASFIRDPGRLKIINGLLDSVVAIHDYMDIPDDVEEQLAASSELLGSFIDTGDYE